MSFFLLVFYLLIAFIVALLTYNQNVLKSDLSDRYTVWIEFALAWPSAAWNVSRRAQYRIALGL